MKQILVSIIALTMTFCFIGCGEKKSSDGLDDILISSDYWYFYDETSGEHEKMSFNENGEFYWGCECGEPVGDSDLLELYDYDEKDKKIKLYSDYDSYSMVVEVLDFSDYHLLLKIGDEIKNYTNVEPNVNETLGVENPKKYIAEYSGEFHAISGNESSVVLTHFDYDGDVEYPDNAFKEYVFADNIEFYSLDVKTHIVDGETVSHREDYLKIDVESAVAAMEGGAVFVWFNDDLTISKMMFYGAVVYG